MKKNLLKKILIIQTAFIGDVILATTAIEQLKIWFPNAKIDFLLRKGNESLLDNNPYLNKVLIWNKKENKNKNLWAVVKEIRANNYDLLINIQRFFSSGLISLFSQAKHKIGYTKNPLSWSFNKKVSHEIGNGSHEIDRIFNLIEEFGKKTVSRPSLFPSKNNFEKVKSYKDYYCFAPASVWFTKQLPKEKWIELGKKVNNGQIIFLGGPGDYILCQEIINEIGKTDSQNLAGKLSFLESAALMQSAKMNYVNDSAPLHIASAMNAPVTAFFCSTTPDFGFGPLSDNAIVFSKKMDCKPCGLHGKKECPEGHFNCGNLDLKGIKL